MKKIIVDTREQHPLDFTLYLSPDWSVQTATLQYGDYSIENFTDLIAVERKSLADFVQCCKSGEKGERDRFAKELIALRGYKCKAVVIEASLSDILLHKYRSEILPASVLGSIASWREKYGVEFIYAENHEQAAGEVFRLLRKFYEHCEDFAKRFQKGEK